MAHYNIQQHSKLHLVLRLRGGMFHFTSGREDYAQAGDLKFPFTLAFADGEEVLSLPNLYGSMKGGELYDIIAGAAKSALAQRRLKFSEVAVEAEADAEAEAGAQGGKKRGHSNS